MEPSSRASAVAAARKRQPAVIAGSCSTWGHPFIARAQACANDEATVQVAYSSSTHFSGMSAAAASTGMTFRLFWSHFCSCGTPDDPMLSDNHDPQHFYLAQCPLTGPSCTLPSLYVASEMFPTWLCSPEKLSVVNLWCGAGECTSSLHYDEEDNLLEVVAGVKRVILISPEDFLFTFPRAYINDDCACEACRSEIGFESDDDSEVVTAAHVANTRPEGLSSESYHHCNSAAMRRFIDAEFARWDSRLPSLPSATLQRLCDVPLGRPVAVLGVELLPGDGLYIPEGWWHAVRSAPQTIAVNTWWRGTRALMQSGAEGSAAYAVRTGLRVLQERRVAELRREYIDTQVVKLFGWKHSDWPAIPHFSEYAAPGAMEGLWHSVAMELYPSLERAYAEEPDGSPDALCTHRVWSKLRMFEYRDEPANPAPLRERMEELYMLFLTTDSADAVPVFNACVAVAPVDFVVPLLGYLVSEKCLGKLLGYLKEQTLDILGARLEAPPSQDTEMSLEALGFGGPDGAVAAFFAELWEVDGSGAFYESDTRRLSDRIREASRSVSQRAQRDVVAAVTL